MSRKTKNQTRYGRGTINRTPQGTFACFLMVDGVRHRAVHKTEADARKWIEATEAQTAAERPLSGIDLSDAARAAAILPAGYTLTDAARILAAAAVLKADTAMSEAAWQFLDARKDDIRPRTWSSYKNVLDRFTRFAGGGVGAATRDQVERFVAGMGPETRNSKIRCLSAFFNWAQDRGLIKDVPTSKVRMAKTSEPAKEILSLEDVQKVLRQAERARPDLVPYLALAFFTGIRSEELTRLDPEKVKAHFIMLQGEVTKKHRARSVRIRPNLRAWLDAYPARVIAPLSERNRYRAIQKICEAAGVAWKSNCARHSFASYAFEETGGDANKVAAEMGEKDVGVFFRHYRGLVHPGDGAKYFSIMPSPPEMIAVFTVEREAAYKKKMSDMGRASRFYSKNNPNRLHK